MQNMTEPIKKEEAPVQPPEQTPEQKVETPEEQKPNVPQDIDYDKELEALKGKTPPPTRSEKEKAAFTVKKLITKFPDIKGELGESEEEPLEDKFGQFSQSFLRQQAESEIRKRSKSESETQYKLWFYYNPVNKTGNVFEDVDDAEWLANKGRTRNALEEMKNKTTPPANASGAGQRGQVTNIPALDPSDVARMKTMGMVQKSPELWEGTKVGLKFNKETKIWEQFRK